MEKLNTETNYAKLFASAMQAFEQERQLLPVGNKEALPKQVHLEIASKIDPILAFAIRKYVPHILPYCNTPMDLAGALSGLILMGEIKDIPREAIPFIGRGVFVAPFFVDAEPEMTRKLLDSVNSKEYPQGEIRDYFFKKQNRFGQFVTCPGILSGTELLRVLLEHVEKTQQMVFQCNLLDYGSNNIRV